MDTHLPEHLYIEKCKNLIALLKECHKRHPFRKFLGICSSFDYQIEKCLKEERIAKAARNFEKSKEMKRKLAELSKEDDD
ncbi:hypothetical protein NQ314_015737 [Rhamnusium bicolor]|uniref:COX assembly mitochondrial protein n=1 Tax=Rhamnusium bicolor TaxID=1586634 RepID=A0AAV8WXB3_9CUCU|nr:hypothetical protein NQ314_015737 [Rhamnusium bicolor]